MNRLVTSPLGSGFICLTLIILFHSPHWWLFQDVAPGSFEWSRAISYLKQCDSLFTTDVEPAMLWRFFPQALVWVLGGSSLLALAFPWFGAWALLSYLFHRAQTNQNDTTTAWAMTLALGATAPVLTSTGWLGFNDAWFTLGLCYLAFGQIRPLIILTCIICPFIDERFVFGIPLALTLRNTILLSHQGAQAIPSLMRQIAYAVAPFLAVRLIGSLLHTSDRSQHSFFLDLLEQDMAYLALAPVAAWMAFRLMLFPAALKLGQMFQTERLTAGLLTATAFVPLALGYFLASDTSRTTGLIMPLCVWAVTTAPRNQQSKWILYATGMLLIPTAHISNLKIAPISSLPVELLRLFY